MRGRNTRSLCGILSVVATMLSAVLTFLFQSSMLDTPEMVKATRAVKLGAVAGMPVGSGEG